MAPPLPPPPPATATAAAHRPPTSSRRRYPEERGGGKKPQPQRSASFHGTTAQAPTDPRGMRRPKTQTDLLAAGSRKGGGGLSPPESRRDGGERRVPSKALVNVTVQRSLGPIQVMALTEWSVGDLTAAAVHLYVKEGRRPPLPTADLSAFGLHYSQFSFECLDPNEKLIELGSRNFFLCPKSISSLIAAAATTPSSSSYPLPLSKPPTSSSSSSYWKEAGKASKIAIPWLRFIDFLL